MPAEVDMDALLLIHLPVQSQIVQQDIVFISGKKNIVLTLQNFQDKRMLFISPTHFI